MSIFKNKEGSVRVAWKILVVLIVSFILNMAWHMVAYRLYTGIFCKGIAPAELGKVLEKSPEFLLFTTLGYLLIIFAVFFFAKKMDKRSLDSMGIVWRNDSLTMLIVGIIGAAASKLIFALFGLGVGVYSYVPQDTSFFAAPGITRYIVFGLLMSFLMGFSEEILFRGYIQQNLMEAVGNTRALIIASIIYTIQEAFATQKPIDLIGIFLAGLFCGYVYMVTSSLYISAAFHSTLHFILLNIVGLQQYDYYKRPIMFIFKDEGERYLGGLGTGTGIATIFIYLLFIGLVYIYDKKRKNSKSISA